MRTRGGAGIMAGLGAGVFLAGFLTTIQSPMASGDQPSMLSLIAAGLGLGGLAVAWVVCLAASAVLGAVLGLLLGARAGSAEAAVGAGLLWGLVWWALVALVGVPLALGGPPVTMWASLDRLPMAVASFMAWVLWGAMLGGGVAWLAAGPRSAAR